MSYNIIIDRQATNVADKLNIESVKELNDDRTSDERVRKSDSGQIMDRQATNVADRPKIKSVKELNDDIIND